MEFQTKKNVSLYSKIVISLFAGCCTPSHFLPLSLYIHLKFDLFGGNQDSTIAKHKGKPSCLHGMCICFTLFFAVVMLH